MSSPSPTPTDTVVLLPGLLCDAAVWQDQRAALQGVHCVVPDYGLLASLTEMAELALREAPGERLCVIGHSMGGRVALEMARLAPQRLARIALLDTGVHARAADSAGLAEQQQRLALLQLAREQGMGAMGRQWARGMVHPDRLDTPLFDEIIRMIERKTPQIYEAQISALLARPDARPLLQGLRCPVLLMCGRQDAWSPLAQHQQMQALLPSAELVVIEDSGHMSTMEQPAAVSAALLRWLQRG